MLEREGRTCMDMKRWLNNRNDIWHRVTVATAVNFNIGEISILSGEQNNLKRSTFFGKLKVGLEYGAVTAVLGYWCNLASAKNLDLKTIAPTFAEL